MDQPVRRVTQKTIAKLCSNFCPISVHMYRTCVCTSIPKDYRSTVLKTERIVWLIYVLVICSSISTDIKPELFIKYAIPQNRKPQKIYTSTCMRHQIHSLYIMLFVQMIQKRLQKVSFKPSPWCRVIIVVYKFYVYSHCIIYY